jgi:hypothetical protein
MRLGTAVILMGSFVLTACGSETRDTAASSKTSDEVVAEAGKLEQPRAGQYETTTEIVEFNIPGLPAAQAEQMKSMMGNAARQSSSFCLTEEEAAKGFEDSIRKMTEGSDGMKCAFDKFDADGGKLDAAMTCQGPQGMNSEITLDGTAGAEASDMRMAMVQKGSMIPGGEMRMEMRMKSRRTGDCS